MAVETIHQELSSSQKEFESLLNDDFKDRKLKEGEIIKATVTEITKNFIVVDCKAKMEGMIPIEEFKNDDELSKLTVGTKIEVFLERIESFKGEIVISREKNAANRITNEADRTNEPNHVRRFTNQIEAGIRHPVLKSEFTGFINCMRSHDTVCHAYCFLVAI